MIDASSLNDPTSSGDNSGSVGFGATKKVMSYDEHGKSKGKQWKSLVFKTGKQSKTQGTDVSILTSLFKWNVKAGKFKPKRGKRVALVISNTVTYACILKKAVDKWRAFHSHCFDEEELKIACSYLKNVKRHCFFLDPTKNSSLLRDIERNSVKFMPK